MVSQSIFHKVKSWKSFKSQLKTLSSKQKGDAFELLTKYYLQLHPTYITQIKDVWLLSEVSTKIHKKLNLPDTDEGIDLIAETKEGTYWAIQCKYKEDETKSLTRKELSTFTDLAFNICENIELGLVCTSSDRASRKLKMHGDRLSFCSGEVWRSLDEGFFKRLRKHLKKKAAPLIPLKPRPHQKRAITKAHGHFAKEKNSRGKLVMPCGTGKSLAGYWIAEKLKAKKILVAVPSLALIKQTLEVWARESVANKQKVNWIVVCSDESVGDLEKDDIAIFIQDLGIKIHTGPKEIAGWLSKKHAGKTIVFSTYQSGKALAQGVKKSKTIFDLAIMDEAHKTVGRSDSVFSHLLYDKNIKINKRIFMTATERRYRGQSDQMLSMEDPEVYGETFEMLSFKEALEAKPPILSDYKIITIFVSKDEIKELIKKNIFVKPDRGRWDNEVEAEMFASLVALRKAMEKYPIKKAVSFHSSIARAKAFRDSQDVFSRSFRKYGKLDTFHVTGKLPTSARAKVIQEFAEANRSLITNARCLTEGVDVPNIDCVLFADPKRSTVDIVQAVGRALRSHKDKKYGYVIVPVLIDKEIKNEKDLDKKMFDSILITLRALAADDNRIVEYFRSIQGRPRGKGSSPIEVEMPEVEPIIAEKFIRSVELKLWNRLAKLSWRPFEEGRNFARGLNFKNVKEWQEYCAGKIKGKPIRPDDIPAIPPRIYQDKGWKTWGDWLGTESVANKDKLCRSFKQARNFVHELELTGAVQWRLYCKGELPGKGVRPNDIPSAPHLAYKDTGWVSWGDWFGTNSISVKDRPYLAFKEARKFIHSLELKDQREWILYYKGKMPEKGVRPDNIPSSPERTYKDKGWKSLGDWLGTGVIGSIKRKFKPFRQARKFSRSLNLKSGPEWKAYCKGEIPNKKKKPQDIPFNPNRTYEKEGWVSMGDWLGTGNIATQLRQHREFNQARKFVHSLNLKSANEWRNYCKGKYSNKPTRPEDIPVAANLIYKDTGWISFPDWLGTENKKK
jgi:superfamily II DNA or RNA helicase